MFTSCKDTDDDMYYGVQKTLGQRIADLEAKLADFPDNYVTKQKLQDELEALKGIYATQDQVDALEQKINAALAALKNQLENYVADITLNQTWNPMFGTINLPVGLSSTITANYYGESDNAFDFPSKQAAQYDALGAESGYATVDDAKLTALLNKVENPFPVPADIYMDMDDEGIASLGKLYLSVNPAGIDRTQLNVSLVNSLDEAVPVEPFTLEESTKELMFGATRTIANGLYEAELKVSKDNAKALKVNIDKEALKSAMKDFIQDRSKSDLVSLAKIMMDQMKDLMPAYAVKAEWDATAYPATPAEGEGEGEGESTEVEGGESATRSVDDGHYTYIGKYEIAATTVQPLGYMFMVDEGTSKKLPTLGSLEEVINKVFDNINIKIDDINFDPENLIIKISLKGIVADGSLTKDEIELKYTPEGQVTPTTPVNDTALNDLVAQINKELGNVSGNINKSIENALNDIKNRLEGKLSGLNNLLSLYNGLASRINNFLANPNHYLQVMMAYEGKDGQLHQLSATKGAPSHFSGNGAMVLYPTSYTAELIAPSCKKYIAITNAWENGAAKSSDDIININEDNGLNKVISGAQQEIALSKLDKNVVYEVLYSSLDYQGHTSTRTFYFTVD